MNGRERDGFPSAQKRKHDRQDEETASKHQKVISSEIVSDWPGKWNGMKQTFTHPMEAFRELVDNCVDATMKLKCDCSHCNKLNLPPPSSSSPSSSTTFSIDSYSSWNLVPVSSTPSQVGHIHIDSDEHALPDIQGTMTNIVIKNSSLHPIPPMVTIMAMDKSNKHNCKKSIGQSGIGIKQSSFNLFL